MRAADEAIVYGPCDNGVGDVSRKSKDECVMIDTCHYNEKCLIISQTCQEIAI